MSSFNKKLMFMLFSMTLLYLYIIFSLACHTVKKLVILARVCIIFIVWCQVSVTCLFDLLVLSYAPYELMHRRNGYFARKSQLMYEESRVHSFGHFEKLALLVRYLKARGLKSAIY
jgi:hypothetical protein